MLLIWCKVLFVCVGVNWVLRRCIVWEELVCERGKNNLLDCIGYIVKGKNF